MIAYPFRQILLLCCVVISSAACAGPGSKTGGEANQGFAGRPEVEVFVQEVAERNALDADLIRQALAQASYQPRVIKLIQPPAKKGVRSWERYRSRFLDQTRISGGLAFWSQYQDSLERAEQVYGVPAEIIVSIIGVETLYGRHVGDFETLSALATLAFDYPPRSALFRRELEQLFILSGEQGRDPSSYVGSYAGALGYPQFLPSSIRHYAVDFDGDGKIDLSQSPVDAIGSVANYLRLHGWENGQPVAERAIVPVHANPATFVDAGIEPVLQPATLAAAGIVTVTGREAAAISTLVDLETTGKETEYWFGYRNFYVITRYNRSSFYAMSVFQLADILRIQRAAMLRAATPSEKR